LPNKYKKQITTGLIVIVVFSFALPQSGPDQWFFNCVKKGYILPAKILTVVITNPDIKDSQGWTPLMYGVQNSNLDIVKFLIDKGADVNYTTERGVSPLLLAIENKDIENAKILLQKGAFLREKPFQKFLTENIKKAEKHAKGFLQSGLDFQNEKEFVNCMLELNQGDDWISLLNKYAERLYIQTPYGKLSIRQATEKTYSDLYKQFKKAFSSLENQNSKRR
jgi:ankyrin repeat protein